MADSTAVAAEPVTNPAEVSKTDQSVELKQDATTEVADAKDDNAADVKSHDKPATDEKTTNGADKDSKSEEKEYTRERRDDCKGRDFKRSNDRYNDRNGRYNKKPRNNEFDNLPETDDPNEIRQQVEFYFSTQNLSMDRHLFLECQGPENRPVSIKHLSTFKRMRRFQPYSAIVAALRDSDPLVVVDDGEYAGTGNEAVKRKDPLVVPARDDDDERKPTSEDLFERLVHSSRNSLEASIYVKGFVEDGEVGQIELENFFRPYGAVMLRKRRDEDDKWKGSVFVEFDTPESQQQFLALDPKPKYNDRDLTILSKKEYSEQKCKEKGITPAWEREDRGEGRRFHDNDRRGRGGGRGRGRGRGGGRGGRGRDNDRRRDRRDRDRSGSRSAEDSRDWNGRRDKFQKSRDYKDRRGRRDDKPADSNNKWNIIRDEDGVPVVQSTIGQPDPSPKGNKRKADDEAPRDEGVKKSKVEIKEDE